MDTHQNRKFSSIHMKLLKHYFIFFRLSVMSAVIKHLYFAFKNFRSCIRCQPDLSSACFEDSDFHLQFSSCSDTIGISVMR